MGIKNAGEMNFIPTHQLLARNLCYALMLIVVLMRIRFPEMYPCLSGSEVA